MVDIALYGHLFLDRIIDGMYQKKTLGGIANCWKTFTQINPSLNVEIKPLAKGEALIYIDRDTNERISNSVMVKEQFDYTPVESKFYHIAYLNDLPDTKFIKDLKGIVTADVCSSKFDFDLLQYVDYLFISDEDAIADITFYSSLTRRGTILHSPKGSVYSDGKIIYEHPIADELYIPNTNVLGAGDMFASCFISQLYQRKSIKDCIDYAHTMTSELIRINNEKI